MYSGGDLDNRLKVFLDALNVPKSAEEVVTPAAQVPDNPLDWPPIFCLVDDDSTVTKLSVTCIKLLTPTPAWVRDEENYLELDVDINIVPITPMTGTLMMLHR